MATLMHVYLAVWMALATTALGALALALIGELTGARWIAAIRAILVTLARGVTPLAILFFPIVLGARAIYPWVDAPHLHATWLSIPWFAARAAAILVVWIVLVELVRARRGAAAPMLVVLGLSITLASFDWLMSLQPGWWSAAYGVHVMIGALGAGTAAATIVAAITRREPATFHALGRLLLAFTVLWGYIVFFEVMLVQIADLPREVVYYVPRLTGGWRWATFALAAGHVVVPTLALLPRASKFRPRYVATIAAWLLAMHLLDLVWLCVP